MAERRAASGPSSTRWLEAEEARVWRGWLTMGRALERGIDRELVQSSGLSAADYQLLVPLSEAPGQQMRARDLGRGAGWERSRLSHHLRRMEVRGLVERQDCPTDARGTVIVLTDLGCAAIRHAAPSHVVWVREHFIDLLTSDEMAVLEGIADRVLSRIAADDPCEASDDGPCDEVAENQGEPQS